MTGKTILHYKVLEKIGEGGMGVVYKAVDSKLKREVAIKFLPHHIIISSDERKRFEIEAQAAAALNHPNITTIYSIEEYEDPQRGKEMFIVMEYICGKELKKVITEGQNALLPTDKIIEYAIQIATGLEAAHEKGIIHRDIKSSNIMITEKDRVKLMDFGLAKMSEGINLTKIGTTVGTVSYMSPEQALGKEADAKSDIWAFGVVLFEMLTGHLPFEGDYEQSIIYSIINSEPASISAVTSHPSYLENIVAKCLQKDPEKRYQKISDILTDLQNKTVYKTDSAADRTKSHSEIVHGKNRNKNRSIKIISSLLAAVVLLIAILTVKPMLDSLLGSNNTVKEQHLAVLPLVGIGGGNANKAFCSGLMETLTSKLTELQQFHNSLWVIPVSEVLRNKVSSPGDANKLFGVNLVVTGSLQQIDNKFRLTLNLINAKDLRQLNSSVIDVTEKDLIILQNKSVISLLEMLNLELNPKLKGILEAGNTNNPEAYEYYIQGRGFLQNSSNPDDVEAAVNSFLLAVRKDSLYAMARSGLAQAYWEKYRLIKKNEWAIKAVIESEIAYKLNSNIAYVNIILGRIHDGTGKYKEAVDDFNRALNIDPVSYEAYRGLAKTYEDQGLLIEAESTFKRAINMRPDDWLGYNSLGVFYYKHSRYDEAIIQFKKVIKLNPRNYLGYSNLGGMYYFQNKLKDASEMFERAYKIKQSYSVASNLGTLYYIRGKYAASARKYEEALRINNNDYVIWGNLGSAYYWAPDERSKARGAFLRAIKLGEEARKVNPNDPELISMLAGYYSMVGEKAKALEYVNMSLKLSPHNAEIMFRAGTTYEQLNERKIAVDWIIKSIENGYSRSDIEKQPELRKLVEDELYKQKVLSISSINK